MIHFILLILWWYVKLPIVLFNIFRWLTLMGYFFIWRWYYTRGVNTPKTQGRETSSFCSKMATWQRRDVFIARDVCAKLYEYATLNDTKQDWRIHRETNMTGTGTKLKIIFIGQCLCESTWYIEKFSDIYTMIKPRSAWLTFYLQRKKNANNTKSLPRCVTFSLAAFIYNYVHGVRDS